MPECLPAPTVDVAARLQEARDHAALHTWDRALEAYGAVLAVAPDHPAAHAGLGDLWMAREQPALAVDHYRRALTADPHLTALTLALGDAYRAQNDLPSAAAAYRQCVAQDTDPRRIARARGALAELEGTPHSLCARCGRFSTLNGFQVAGSGKQTLCPQCYADTQPRRARRAFIFYGCIVLLELLWLCWLRSDLVLSLIANSLLIFAFSYALLVPHELAHALVARALGGRVFELHLGVGRTLWEGHAGQTRLSVHRYPLAGYCILAFPTHRGIRARTLAAVAAGVVPATLIVLFLLPGTMGGRPLDGLAFRETLVAAAAIQVVTNLLPRRVHLGAGTQTDGAAFLQMLSNRTSSAVLHLHYFLLAGQHALRRGAFAEAAALCREGLDLYPASTLLETVCAVAQLNLRQTSEVVDDFRTILSDFEAGKPGTDLGIPPTQHVAVRAVLYNNIAAAMVAHDGGSSDPDRAREYGYGAYEIVPWSPAVESTWGTVLLLQGRPELGLAYLSAALAADEDPRSRASTLAYMALAHQRLGRPAHAGACLDQAYALDADHYSVRRVRALLTQDEGAKAGISAHADLSTNADLSTIAGEP